MAVQYAGQHQNKSKRQNKKFEANGLKITIDTNKKIVNFLRHNI